MPALVSFFKRMPLFSSEAFFIPTFVSLIIGVVWRINPAAANNFVVITKLLATISITLNRIIFCQLLQPVASHKTVIKISSIFELLYIEKYRDRHRQGNLFPEQY